MVGLDSSRKNTPLACLRDHSELGIYYEAMAPLPSIMRLLGLWEPPESSYFARQVYPWIVWAIVFFPWAHFFIREGAVDMSYSNSLVFALSHLLFIVCLASARRYFRTSHFFETMAMTFGDKHDVYCHFDGADNEVATRARRAQKLNEFRKIVRRCALQFTVVTTISTGGALHRSLATLTFLAVAYACFIVLASGSNKSAWLVVLDIINVVCTAVGTATFTFMALFAKMVFQVHLVDVARHVSLFSMHERRRHQHDGSLVAYRIPAKSKDYTVDEAAPLHALSSALLSDHESDLSLQPPLRAQNWSPMLLGWSRRDLAFLDDNSSNIVSDYLRLSTLINTTSRRFRAFLVYTFFLAFVGGVLSAYILLGSVKKSHTTQDVADYVPNLLNLVFSLSAMSAAAKIAHKSQHIVRRVTEFCACASLLRPGSGEKESTLLAMQGRATALVHLVSKRPLYLSLYGIVLNRDVALGIVSPVVALLLFLVQHFLLQQDN